MRAVLLNTGQMTTTPSPSPCAGGAGVTDIGTFLGDEMCKGSGFSLLLLLGIILITLGAIAEGFSKAKWKRAWVPDALAMIESLGKIAGAVAALGAFVAIVTIRIGPEATGFAFTFWGLLIAVGAAISVLVVSALRAKPNPLPGPGPNASGGGGTFKWVLPSPPTTPPTAVPTLSQLVHEADALTRQCEQAERTLLNLPSPPAASTQTLSDLTAAAKDLEKRLRKHRQGAEALTGLKP